MTVDGTIKVITDNSQLLSKGDIIAIIVAVISVSGVIISTILSNRTSKNLYAKNEKQQEKWNQKKIDAQLIAHARIEWIQNVRNTTAELISLYFALLNTYDKDD